MMKKGRTFLYLLIGTALLAWPMAYGPDIWQRHITFDAMQASTPHWSCLIDNTAVGYNYDGITTRPYIVLGNHRYYSNEFRRWNSTAAGRILLVVDDTGKLRWTRITRTEALNFAQEHNIAGLSGCQRMGDSQVATNNVTNSNGSRYAPTGNYAAPTQTRDTSFTWEKAVGPAIKPLPIKSLHR
jgi:hypothetical protein